MTFENLQFVVDVVGEWIAQKANLCYSNLLVEGLRIIFCIFQ